MNNYEKMMKVDRIESLIEWTYFIMACTMAAIGVIGYNFINIVPTDFAEAIGGVGAMMFLAYIPFYIVIDIVLQPFYRFYRNRWLSEED